MSDDPRESSRQEEERASFSAGPRRRPKRAQPRIVNPETHPRSTVCLTVAAEFLGLDERSVRARIEDGRLPADRDGKVYRIAIADLCEYERRRKQAS